MTGLSSSGSYTLEADDKATSVTIYTAQACVRGVLVTRRMVRVGAWLRIPGLPDYASIYDATVVRGPGAGTPIVEQYREVHVAVPQIIAMHLTPPEEEPVEYDQYEQNRKMEPVAALAGPFRFDGKLRMPVHMSLTKQMSMMRDPFIVLYDTLVTSTFDPEPAALPLPMVMVRPIPFCFVPGTRI